MANEILPPLFYHSPSPPLARSLSISSLTTPYAHTQVPILPSTLTPYIPSISSSPISPHPPISHLSPPLLSHRNPLHDVLFPLSPHPRTPLLPTVSESVTLKFIPTPFLFLPLHPIYTFSNWPFPLPYLPSLSPSPISHPFFPYSLMIWAPQIGLLITIIYNYQLYIIRHSPPGMPYGFVRFIFYFLFFRRQGFRMITFDRQAGPFQNFSRSQVMVIGRSVSFSDPARPPGGECGAPNTPKSPPPQIVCAFQNPRNIFWRIKTPGTFVLRRKKISINKNFQPPPPHPHAPAQPSEHSPQSWFNNK